MTTKLKGPEGSTNAQVDGIDYEVGDDGLFEVDNGGHVAILRGMGFLTEAEASSVSEAISKRWPNVAQRLLDQDKNLVGVTTAEGVLDIIEAEIAPPVAEEVEPGPADNGPGDCPDFSKFKNRGTIVEWLVANGDDTHTPAEDRQTLELAARELHAKLASLEPEDEDEPKTNFAEMNHEELVAWLTDANVELTDDLTDEQLVALATAKAAEEETTEDATS